jgi:hypothetical protein
MIDKAALLAASLPTVTVDLPGAGAVSVRGLTRSEVHSLGDLKSDVEALERRILRLGMADPAMDDVDVKAFYESAPSEWTDLIVTAISRLSGILKESPKSDVPGLRDGRGP